MQESLDLKNEIVSRLKLIRAKSGLSQTSFAKELGVSSGNVGMWETGKALPGAIALIAIAQKFDCSTDWILTGHTSTIINMDTLPEINKKAEAIIDPDLKEMYDILKMLMLAGDADLRGWTKIQFKNAFKDYLAMIEEEKKLHA